MGDQRSTPGGDRSPATAHGDNDTWSCFDSPSTDRSPYPDLSVTSSDWELSNSTIIPSPTVARLHEPTSAFVRRGLVRQAQHAHPLLPKPDIKPYRTGNLAAGLFPTSEYSAGFVNILPRPLGVIGDRRPSVFMESSSVPTRADQPQTAPHGAPLIRGFGYHPSTVQSDSDPATASPPEPKMPLFFQPMTSLNTTGTSYLPSQLEGFNPAHPYSLSVDQLAQSMQKIELNDPAVGAVTKMENCFSPYYQGDTCLAANQSENIPDDMNCSLFIVNLPPSLTTHELVAAIHKMGPLGRIFAIHINVPEPQRNHPGCAAKVVFFRRWVAHTFFSLCELNGFNVKGFSARVMWNRIKTSEKPHLVNSDASRVLLIAGPANEVNSIVLTEFFRQKLEFQVDRIITHSQGSLAKNNAVVEYRFGSFRCQAQAAKMALAREKPHIRCFFGKDPLGCVAYKPFEYFNFNNNV